jgi:hypothetical protein
MSIKVLITNDKGEVLFSREINGQLQEITIKTDKDKSTVKIENEKVLKKVLKKNLFDMV